MMFRREPSLLMHSVAAGLCLILWSQSYWKPRVQAHMTNACMISPPLVSEQSGLLPETHTQPELAQVLWQLEKSTRLPIATPFPAQSGPIVANLELDCLTPGG